MLPIRTLVLLIKEGQGFDIGMGHIMTKDKNQSQLIIYQAEDGKIKIDVRFQDETVWLTQQLMAELFQTTKQNVSLYIKNIFEEGELAELAVVKEYLTTAPDGKRYKTS